MNRNLLNGYPEQIIDNVETLYKQKKLESYINARYPDSHEISSDKALFNYIQGLKKTYMKKAPPIHKIIYDDKIDTVYNALGLHSSVTRIQGNKLKAKSEIRISSIFKKTPADFLEMIAVHELAHLKVKSHDKEFYKLCTYMLPEYAQLEFDFRVYLINMDY